MKQEGLENIDWPMEIPQEHYFFNEVLDEGFPVKVSEWCKKIESFVYPKCFKTSLKGDLFIYCKTLYDAYVFIFHARIDFDVYASHYVPKDI